MKHIIITASALIIASGAMAQDKYFTRDGYIRFFSATPMENIEAKNKKVTAVLDEATGKLEFSALMKSFEFEKALMQEHFNENYVESNTYPKASFKGTVTGFDAKAYAKETKVMVKGIMDMHGVQKEIEVPGTIVKQGANYVLKSKFMMKPEDYKIVIPNTVKDNIAKEIEVTVETTLAVLSK